jgi:hypothetical protein
VVATPRGSGYFFVGLPRERVPKPPERRHTVLMVPVTVLFVVAATLVLLATRGAS